jgi:hypothetical protein
VVQLAAAAVSAPSTASKNEIIRAGIGREKRWLNHLMRNSKQKLLNWRNKQAVAAPASMNSGFEEKGGVRFVADDTTS